MALSLQALPPFPVRSKQIRVASCRSRISACLKSSRCKQHSDIFKPPIWHDNFIQSLSSADEHEGRNKERICKLKEEVSQMLHKEMSLRDKLELVDAVQQLGVAYHFRDWINSVIAMTHESNAAYHFSLDNDIYVVSLIFRLLRMHGYSVQEDIFRKYLDNEGSFKSMLSSDIKGILSLYEASYLAKEGEETLDVARQFATNQLTNCLKNSEYNDSRLKERVAHALEVPLNWRVERSHTRWYIEQNKNDEKMRPALWELAVLDFNVIQNKYKEELKHMSRWWTNLGLYEKLPFIRDRLVECYFWSVACALEPEHASYRIAQAMSNCLIVTIDDIYDVYGSLDELEVFTDAVEKWDVTASKGLPENIQMCFLALYNTVNEMSYGVLKTKELDVAPYLRRAWTNLCKAYLLEARWRHDGYVPTLDEYLENGWVSISGHVALSTAYCINDYVSAEDLERFSSECPDIVQYSSMHLRLYNDLATSSDEKEWGDNIKSIQCYLNEKKVTESIARKKVKEMIWKNWTLLNGEVLGGSEFQKYLRNVALNIARMSQFTYGQGDGFGKPDYAKNEFTSLLLEPVKF